MKKLLLVVAVTLFAAGSLSAQDNPEIRKGYIGITMGPAFSIGDMSNYVSGGASCCSVKINYPSLTVEKICRLLNITYICIL